MDRLDNVIRPAGQEGEQQMLADIRFFLGAAVTRPAGSHASEHGRIIARAGEPCFGAQKTVCLGRSRFRTENCESRTDQRHKTCQPQGDPRFVHDRRKEVYF